MTEYRQHELAKFIPRPTQAEQDALTESIRLHGQIDPGHLYEGKILDGWSRYLACKALNIEFKFVEFHSNGVGPLEFIMSKLEGRNLTQSQKACLGVQFKIKYAQEIKWKMRTGNNRMTPKHQLNGRGIWASEYAARIVKVNDTLISRAHTVFKKDPILFEEVKQGKLTVNRAFRRVKGREVMALNEAAKNGFKPPQAVYNLDEAHMVIRAMGREGWEWESRYKEGVGYKGHFFGNYGERHWLSWNYVKPHSTFHACVCEAANEAYLKKFE